MFHFVANSVTMNKLIDSVWKEVGSFSGFSSLDLYKHTSEKCASLIDLCSFPLNEIEHSKSSSKTKELSPTKPSVNRNNEIDSKHDYTLLITKIVSTRFIYPNICMENFDNFD